MRKIKWYWLIAFVCMVFTCFLTTETAWADVDYSYEFNKKEKAYYISGVKILNETDVILELPLYYNGYPVVGIKDKAIMVSGVKKIIVPYGYKSIDEWAFAKCENLEEVVIYGEIEVLEGHVFHECTNLKTVVLPNTLKKIEWDAFYESGIRTLTIPESVEEIEKMAFRGCDNMYQLIVKSEKLTIGENIFLKPIRGREPYATNKTVTIVAPKGSDAPMKFFWKSLMTDCKQMDMNQ